MKILSIKASNFASYKELEFDFNNQGLTLIEGPTGSGKSTLCDLIPWALFGRTAKNGAVSEVLQWPGDKVTQVKCIVKVHEYPSIIVRSRGPNPKDNDLYIADQGQELRGKDLLDTQKLINNFLKMDYDLYLASSYYHEFSQTAQFFTTTAKNRRAICEQLVDLSLPKTLQGKTLEELKIKKVKLSEINSQINTLQSNIELLSRLQEGEKTKAEYWTQNHEAAKDRALKVYEAYETNRKKIVSKKCNSCGTVLVKPKEVIDTSENPHFQVMERLTSEVNPHTGSLKDYSSEIEEKSAERFKNTGLLIDIENEIEELELLQQVLSDYRSVSIQNTIKDIESTTNQLLSDYFDAEFRVEFDVADADKLDINIYKDGNIAVYTQLSKGQRCLLKLTFGTAVMRAVTNHHSITASQIFYDESLDGLDDNMKQKAFRLLETVSQNHESVFVVEHSEALKPLFNNSYTVSMTSEGSVIAKT